MSICIYGRDSIYVVIKGNIKLLTAARQIPYADVTISDGEETVDLQIILCRKKYSNGTGIAPVLSHQNDIFINELVGRDFQVERRRALANTSGDIVV